MKKALIDTDIISFFFKGDEKVAKKIIEYTKEYDHLNLSIITQFEILGGLEYKNAYRQIEQFSDFVNTKCKIFNLTRNTIRRSAELYGKLRRKGITIGNSDLLIAGIAIENKLQLITNNEKHYQEIEGLDMDNWRK